ncbi:MAG: hypothetical protein HOY79_43930 [Streptomyces sp.]|nr:hypothetical protein [Streptomyces sp.]
MNKPKTGTIYALDDPRDGSTRYVGKTTQDPLGRLAGHLATATNPAMRVWLNALGAQGLIPHMRTIKNVALDKLDAEEKRQIERHAKAGHRLFNAPHYHQNLKDLSQPSVLPVQDQADQKTATHPVERIAHRVYGPLAAAWAAGRIPVLLVAVYVLVLAPIVAVALLVQMLFGVRWIRRTASAGGAACYLWTVGFSRMVRDFVLPHLPINGLVAFWRAYLAHPVRTLGLHFLVAVLLMALLSYVPVAEAARAAQPRRGRRQPTQLPWDEMDPVDVAAAAAAALDGVALKELPPWRP